jgi:hypothetical protein
VTTSAGQGSIQDVSGEYSCENPLGGRYDFQTVIELNAGKGMACKTDYCSYKQERKKV